MKTLLLCASLLAAPTFADKIDPERFAEVMQGIAEAQQYQEPLTGNGYDDLSAAGLALQNNPLNAALQPPENVSAEEKLRLQRAAVAANAEALRLLRVGLQKGVARPGVPLARFGSAYAVVTTFAPNSRFRQLARLLDVEAQTKIADGDWSSAATTTLDTMEFGVVSSSNGTWIENLTGVAIESIGRKRFAEVAAHLDAPQLEAAAQRLEFMERRRPPLHEFWRVEKNSSLYSVGEILRLSDEKLEKEGGLSRRDARQVRKLGSDEILQIVRDRYEEFERRTRWNYPQKLGATLPPTSVEFLNRYYPGLPQAYMESGYLRAQSENRLLVHALRLRAHKLETGAYPAKLETAADPFADNRSLIYKRDGDAYTLYSIGSNAQDDGGAPLKRIEQPESEDDEDNDNDHESLSKPQFDGDIVALVL